MPVDRSSPQPSWPLKPALASSRTAKTPLTPRLAVAPTAASANTLQNTRIVRNNSVTAPRANTPTREDFPVKAFLNTNVTPRSASRKSRGIESTSSTPGGTPNATPNTSRPASIAELPPNFGYIVPGNNTQNGARPRLAPAQGSGQPAMAPRLPYANMYNSAHSEMNFPKDMSSSFFHANDAKSNDQSTSQKKASAFFYANGEQDRVAPKAHIPSPPLSNAMKAHPDSRFFHADSLAESRDRPPSFTQSPPCAPQEFSPRPSPIPGSTARQQSPSREATDTPIRKGISYATRPPLPSRNSSTGSNTADGGERPRRPSSASSVVRFGHAKSASLSSIDAMTSDLKKPLPNQLPTIPPSPLYRSDFFANDGPMSQSMGSIPSSPTARPGYSSPTPASPGRVPQSPGRAGERSALEVMNELAANARRERKVLDLEISNSSLLAINRSLEKEVRKQKAELRRFRRMSRAGRFSLDPVDSVADTTDFSHVGDLSDMSEEEEVPGPEEEDIESSTSSMDEGAMSPSAQAESDATHRLGDEKRLQLDLTKHRELLVDSQKMNQSLKRCMGWTEQLIKDGQKALAYKVNVSDVKLGGRVLVSEDDHEDTELGESRGLLSPWSPLHEAMDALDSPFFNDPTRTADRDSGVDVEEATAVTSDLPEDVVHLGSPFEERIKHLQVSIDALEAS